jgi:hypothetical protein
MRPGALSMRYNGWNRRQFRAPPSVFMTDGFASTAAPARGI